MRSLSRPLIFLAAVIIIAAIFLFGYYYGFKKTTTYEPGEAIPTPTASTSPAIGSTPTPLPGSSAASSSAERLLALSSSTDTTNWKKYANDELGIEFDYPPNLIAGETGTAITLAFPKNIYFHWPLLDDAKITVAASTTCLYGLMFSGSERSAPASTTLNGLQFSYREGQDNAAGNVYREFEFHVRTKQACYQLNLFNHGANGAGFYVDDRTLIKQYDAQHAADLNAVKAVFAAVVKSFRVRLPPPGIPEDKRPQ